MDMEENMESARLSAAEQSGHMPGGADLMNRKNQKKHLAVTCILIMLFASGMIINESDYLGSNHTSVVTYLEVYSAFLPLLVYIIPFGIVVKWLSSRYALPSLELLTAVFCGAFIPASLAGEVNGNFDDLMKSLMGASYSDAWIGSAEAGITEELLKLATTAMFLYVLNRKSLQHYLTIGMCVGMGFQIEEDISYITESGFANVNDAFPTAMDRISGAFGSHWAYAAVTAAGLWLIVRADRRNHRRKGIVWILLVVADHFLYDSPLGESLLFNAILTAAVVLPVIIFYRSPETTAEEKKSLPESERFTSM